MADNFLNMDKKINRQINEAHRTLNSCEQTKFVPRNIIMKILEIQHKHRILKVVKQNKYKQNKSL